MIVPQLIEPRSIAVIGASNATAKPGGKVIANLLQYGYGGSIYPVNPKEQAIQGLPAFPSVERLPQTDLAVLAIPAAACHEAVATLAEQKGTRAFIVLSAGFSEEGDAGSAREHELVTTVERHGASLIGPNCIGVITPAYPGVFTTPIPPIDPRGCDLISGSGATAVFIMEAGIPKGLRFSRVFSVGNSAQIGVEEVLEYLDTVTAPPNPKLLYIESIRNPAKLLRHARSLIAKGCRIAAVKAGSSEAGGRAASSHTGALAGSDAAVGALFRKAGIVRCRSREELTSVGVLFSHPPLRGDRFAVITHAGGPAVMLTDTLSEGGFEVPHIGGPAAERLKERLYPGSSVANPIDFLATGSPEQLGAIIDACDTEFDEVDAMAVIFGSPGLFPVDEAYEVLDRKMRTATKPIYPVLPSLINASRESEEFARKGNAYFTDEVALGRALALVRNTPSPSPVAPRRPGRLAAPPEETAPPQETPAPGLAGADGYLPPDEVERALDAAGIPRVPERVAGSRAEAIVAAREFGFPLVAKVVGPVHKSDVGGVSLGIEDEGALAREYARIAALPGATGVLIQPMRRGLELFAGASREEPYGHLLVVGMGGVLVEILHDVAHGLAPLGAGEAEAMVRSLRGYPLIRGVRGQPGVDEGELVRILNALSDLVTSRPEIAELDLNPLLASEDGIVAVDARIRVVPADGDSTPPRLARS